MKKFRLQRLWSTADYTVGRIIELKQDNHVAFTIERAWKNNERLISRIPTGLYTCNYCSVSSGGSLRDCYYIRDVAGRDAIYIHRGNTVDESKGCVLIGREILTGSGGAKLLGSDLGMKDFHRFTGKGIFELEVKDETI